MASNENAPTWTPDLAREYCSGAARLEMWTIPLYLCVAYSIKNPDNPDTPITWPQALKAVQSAHLDSSDAEAVNAKLTDDSGLAAMFAFYSILSVAIQEMLHAELAANLCNAVKGKVDFTGEYTSTPGSLAPVYDAQHVPYINVPENVAPLVKLGPLDGDSIELLQWIEHYDDPPTTPTNGPLDKYDSIGDLYQSLKYGVDTLWTDLYPQTGAPGPKELNQKDNWHSVASKNKSKTEDYEFSIRIYGASADAQKLADGVIEAIVSQGEGAQAGDHKMVNPIFQLKHGNAVEIALDTLTHYERFTIIKDLLASGVTIDTWQVQDPPPDAETLHLLQQALSQSYSSFLDSLTEGFNSRKRLGLDAMAGIGSRIYEVWQAGGLPDLSYQVYVAPQYPHACQGLNACQGQGFNGTGTGAGDGDCATAWVHTCSTTNKCKSQGGCGYSVSSAERNWVPSENACTGQGGCGAPIPETQGFNYNAPNPPGGTNPVWDYARQLFEARMKAEGKTVLPAKPVNKLRHLLDKTSPPPPKSPSSSE